MHIFQEGSKEAQLASHLAFSVSFTPCFESCSDACMCASALDVLCVDTSLIGWALHTGRECSSLDLASSCERLGIQYSRHETKTTLAARFPDMMACHHGQQGGEGGGQG